MRKQAEEETEEAAIPYLAHLMSVAALVLEHGGDEDEAIAALLHDGPEDQGGRETLDRIRERFGDRVAEIVEGCSDTFEHPKPKWKPRSVFLVSLADKVHNLRSIHADHRRIGGKVWERFSGRRKGTLWYYKKLLKIYREEAPPRCKPLVKEMQRTLLQVKARG
jgi:(p)ppGpp synthase/HD superfamily hydrolase